MYRIFAAVQTMLGCSIQRKQTKNKKRRETIMSNNNGRNKIMVPNAREAMNKFKMEAANDLRVPPPS